ncbi:MAG: hypothetical protein ACJAWL_003327 [Motiliproteus sp.]|jgi:hypothetical protein
MMIAELVDQDDFYNLLQAIGIPLESHWTPEHCAQAALAWRAANDNHAAEAKLSRVVSELKNKEPLLLPEVKEALLLLL